MNIVSDDEPYRGYELSALRSGLKWCVTIWPTEPKQLLPDPREPSSQAFSREMALAVARSRIDDLLG